MKPIKQLNQAFPDKSLSLQQLIFCGLYELIEEKSIENKTDEKTIYVQSKLDFGDYDNTHKRKKPDIKPKFFINEKNVVELQNPYCKFCHSHKNIKWDIRTREIITDKYSGEIKIQRYKCKSCGKTFQTEFNGIIDPYSHYSKDIIDRSVKVKQLNWSSLRDISHYYEIFNDINISHETIRNMINVIKTNEIHYDVPKVSGYYSYDAQWVKINKKWKYRHVLFDIVQEIPIAELFSDEDTDEIVFDFIDKNSEQRNRTGIVTDLKPGYRNLMNKLKFKRHQFCIFHFKQAINKRINEEISKIKRIANKRFKKMYENQSNDFINEKIEKIIKEWKDEINSYLNLFYEVFKKDSFNEAESHIHKLKQKLNTFPKFFKDYLLVNFFPIYKNFIYFLEKPHKGKLDYTNNQLEGFFRSTLPKSHKKSFRTFEGLINQAYHRGNGWIENKRKNLNVKKLF